VARSQPPPWPRRSATATPSCTTHTAPSVKPVALRQTCRMTPVKGFPAPVFLGAIINQSLAPPTNRWKAQSVADVIAARQGDSRRARLASSGNGTVQHLALEMFRHRRRHTSLNHIPYRGGGPRRSTISSAAGESFFSPNAAASIGARAGGHHQMPRAYRPRQARGASHVPALAERLPDSEAYEWQGLFCARQHAREDRAKAQCRALNAVLRQPDIGRASQAAQRRNSARIRPRVSRLRSGGNREMGAECVREAQVSGWGDTVASQRPARPAVAETSVRSAAERSRRKVTDGLADNGAMRGTRFDRRA